MDVVVLKHLLNSFKLAAKDLCNIASNFSEIAFGDLYFFFVFSLVECIQSGLQLKSLFKGIEEIIHFVSIVENHFLVIIDIIVELFELIHIVGLELKHFLYY
jgi:hypothetical protein